MTEPKHVLNQVNVLDHGFVKLLNLSGPVRRADIVHKFDYARMTSVVVQDFDADDIDPALVARTSFDGEDYNPATDMPRTREEELKLVKYLMDRRHTTPIEMIECWLEMKMPIFVARQFVRHRTVSINEVSARYVQLDNEFYIPKPEDVGAKSKSNKQGRDMSEESASAADYCTALKMHCEDSYELYENAINRGIPNELARCSLPVNIYTRWVWKQDLHNMMHMLRLRMDPHAQFEIRQYAEAIHSLLSEQLPDLMKFFDEQMPGTEYARYKYAMESMGVVMEENTRDDGERWLTVRTNGGPKQKGYAGFFTETRFDRLGKLITHEIAE